MTNRLDQTFEGLRAASKKALVTFTMAGDPDAARSLALLQELAASGSDILEIGMPFTDPMADGAVIQAAGLRALENKVGLKQVLEIVQQFRSNNNITPIVLMGYFNPILSYGIDEFMRNSAISGVDGLILVDIPPEEAQEILPKVQQNNIALIRLLTPTTDAARLPKVLNGATGFLYYVSIAGVTGTKSADAGAVKRHIEQIRQSTDLPIVVGFGIKTPEDAKRFSAFADGVVVGSTIIQNIEQNQGSKDLIPLIGAQVKSLRQAV